MKSPISILSIFVIFFLLINCKKEKVEDTPPVRTTKGLKIKILEYGTDLPLANVKFSDIECKKDEKITCFTYKILKTWISGPDGTVTLLPIDVAAHGDYYQVEGANHWIKSNTIFDTLISKPLYDSGVVRMFPVASVNFHFKAVNNYSAKERLALRMEGVRSPASTFFIEAPLNDYPLAYKLDTLFTHKIYGNVNNWLVVDLLDSNSSFVKTLYNDKKFISKTGNPTWIINF